MKKRTLLMTLFAAAPLMADTTVPLVDGECGEYRDLEAKTWSLPHGITLSAFQDAGNLWLCYDLPEDSMGTLDLVLQTPRMSSAMNLHVSAQLGEWPVDAPDSAPASPDSERWWQVSGWWSNAVSLNGMERSGQAPRPRFIPSPGRELQLSKAHFGEGAWQLRFNIRSVKDADGERHAFTWPATDEAPLVIDTRSSVAETSNEAALREIKTVLWPRAYRTGDVVLLGRLLHSSFQMIDGDGNRSTRQQELDWVAENHWNPGTFEYRIERLDIYHGRVAIVDGMGVAERYSYRSSNVLIKEAGRWQAVASHVSGYRED